MPTPNCAFKSSYTRWPVQDLLWTPSSPLNSLVASAFSGFQIFTAVLTLPVQWTRNPLTWGVVSSHEHMSHLELKCTALSWQDSVFKWKPRAMVSLAGLQQDLDMWLKASSHLRPFETFKLQVPIQDYKTQREKTQFSQLTTNTSKPHNLHWCEPCVIPIYISIAAGPHPVTLYSTPWSHLKRLYVRIFIVAISTCSLWQCPVSFDFCFMY